MNKTNITKLLLSVKKASKDIALLSSKKRVELLSSMSVSLKKNKKIILSANEKDVKLAKKQGLTDAFIDRLTLTSNGFDSVISQLESVAASRDVLGEIIQKKKLKNGINLVKQRFPLGVILMIYESRPNVTIDAASLSLKAGNAVILKGGIESSQTNKAFISILHKELKKFKVSQSAITLLENATHKDVKEFLKRSDLIDVVIPRGNYELTSTVAKESRIPVLYHSAGGARMYVDKSADLKESLEVCVNAKTQRTSVCNAMDTLLVHKDIATKILPQIDQILFDKKFEIRADEKAKGLMSHSKLARDKDFSTEFLDSILAVKVVDSAESAFDFITKNTHNHTEILCAKDNNVIQNFINNIDAAGLMINCSSRLHDGGEFEMGAEMGTATGKLHARGPVGARELTTHKWIAYGSGQVRK